MQERYGQIRIGMAPAEVNRIMDRAPMTVDEISQLHQTDGLKGMVWRTVASEPPFNSWTFTADYVRGFTSDGTTVIVHYQHGSSVSKAVYVRMTPLELKFRWWLQRLGLSTF
jgi:hypothetical protein